eukprot:24339-Eustigmatos_ZCMA.PRE.1
MKIYIHSRSARLLTRKHVVVASLPLSIFFSVYGTRVAHLRLTSSCLARRTDAVIQRAVSVGVSGLGDDKGLDHATGLRRHNVGGC